ncbi:MAG: tRNA epoxyqueuosine(34) reductase QueG [Acidobacteria bacterium]|nr:tRNA epoxyqueuosine(34) reductase QueG [Acidobacteriota bacterium]MBI3663338.1 tRNA epoxyqueuosine(34) reductase QueG [Acidobacteriota bacterium]
MVAQARALGMDLCGVAPAADFEELTHLEEWLARGYAGEMRYLEDRRRRSPAAALEGARGSASLTTGSIVVCALNYNTALPYSTEVPPVDVAPDVRSESPAGAEAPEEEMESAHRSAGRKPRPASRPAESGPRGWISRYAWGDDYHDVLGKKLDALLGKMRRQFGEEFAARAYVDTGPVVERVAAKYAGLGWLAKNTCLINEQLGSWLFLGVILTTLELEPSVLPQEGPPADLCGNCRLCIEACPTGAIVEPYVLDARRCISYLTIELRGSIPEEFREPMGRMVFGCDICQDVCPWNRKAAVTQAVEFLPRKIETRNWKVETRGKPHVAAAFRPASAMVGVFPCPPPSASLGTSSGGRYTFTPELEWLASLSEEEFREVFRGSAVKRTKWRGLVRNACIALGNAAGRAAGDAVWRERVAPLLERLAGSEDAGIANAARWAWGRL